MYKQSVLRFLFQTGCPYQFVLEFSYQKTVTPVHENKTNHVELTELTDLCSCDKKRGHSIDNDGVFKSTTISKSIFVKQVGRRSA